MDQRGIEVHSLAIQGGGNILGLQPDGVYIHISEPVRSCRRIASYFFCLLHLHPHYPLRASMVLPKAVVERKCRHRGLQQYNPAGTKNPSGYYPANLRGATKARFSAAGPTEGQRVVLLERNCQRRSRGGEGRGARGSSTDSEFGCGASSHL